MAFCMNCGKQLPDSAKFCVECGAKANHSTINHDECRKTVYDGEIHKCPNCGDMLDAHELICETCGYERRGQHTSASMRWFANALKEAASDEERATLISEYPVPNNREDILEFIILSSTNIAGKNNHIVFNAWVSKYEQCYQKSLILPLSQEDKELIRSIHKKTSWRIFWGKPAHVLGMTFDRIKNAFLSIKNPILRIAIIVLLLSWIPLFRVFEAFAGFGVLVVVLIYLMRIMKQK